MSTVKHCYKVYHKTQNTSAGGNIDIVNKEHCRSENGNFTRAHLPVMYCLAVSLVLGIMYNIRFGKHKQGMKNHREQGDSPLYVTGLGYVWFSVKGNVGDFKEAISRKFGIHSCSFVLKFGNRI